ncbi:MAG: LamG domain-containing protein, partial [Patescibacteria group bacterium]|nr:LamG domain-containing protein [Patescibacteria group bacterium]
GTIAYDRSGYNNNGTLINGPTWQTETNCKVGKCLSFDGVDDYVNTNNNQNLKKYTIMVWIMSFNAPTSTPGSGPINRENNYQINWNHDSLSFRGAAALRVNGFWYAATFGTLLGNEFYYLAASYDGENLKSYKNGVLIFDNSSPSGDPDNEGAFLKFGRHALANQYANGIFDEIRIYNRALSNSEIRAIYEATK